MELPTSIFELLTFSINQSINQSILPIRQAGNKIIIKLKNMCARRIRSSNTTLYLIAVVVIIIAFFLLGGGPWIRGSFHGSRSYGAGNLQWIQILVSLAIGFVLGLLAAKRRWF
jgi:hypothetical protein